MKTVMEECFRGSWASVHLRVLIFCREMCFSSCRRSLTSDPYFPQVPLSVKMKWEWLLFSTASLLSGLAIVWYGLVTWQRKRKTQTS